MSTTTTMKQRSALDPWTPPDGDVEWMGDPWKRANHLRLMEAHNESLYREAVAFVQTFRDEIDQDARAGRAA